MKLSKFNIIEKLDEGLIIYNTNSAGVLLLNSEYSSSFWRFVESGIMDKQDLEKELKNGRMLVDDDCDEMGMLRTMNNIARYDAANLTFTIAPTMECNFGCPYCFEEGFRYNSMTDETSTKTISFINQMAQNVNSLSVCWYGGEPTLGIKRIEEISSGIIGNLKENQYYGATIVTNGYNLTKKMVERLKACHIDYCQITLDGPPEIHDNRRFLIGRDGQKAGPTFHKILQNIKDVHEDIKINIRVNVDRTNIEHVDKILDLLEEHELRNKVGFYIAAVDDSASSCVNPDCFSSYEFSGEEMRVYRKALQRGFNTIRIPTPPLGICGAVSPSSFVIDPLGDLYKCWNEIGRKERSVGTVSSGVKYNSVLVDYMDYDPFKTSKCSDCSVMPACLGGCPYVAALKQDPRCDSIRFNAKHMIRLLHEVKSAELPVATHQ